MRHVALVVSCLFLSVSGLRHASAPSLRPGKLAIASPSLEALAEESQTVGRTIRPLTRRLALTFLALQTVTGLSMSSSAARTFAVAPRPQDLLVVGAGYLGQRVAARWQEAHPGARVIGATLTETSHPELQAAGVEPITVETLFANPPLRSFQHVVFAAPPRIRSGGSPEDYISAISDAASLWDNEAEIDSQTGLGPGFVFTSSAGVFAESSGGVVDETSPVSDSERQAVLLRAEDCVRRASGTALRLAGLYDTRRGPHTFWLKAGTVKGNPDGLVNMLHYEDAAGAVVAALERGSAAHGKVFVVADGTPLTRAEIVDAACAAAPFASFSKPVFDAPPEAAQDKGKVLRAERAREELRWTPKYASMREFMAKVKDE